MTVLKAVIAAAAVFSTATLSTPASSDPIFPAGSNESMHLKLQAQDRAFYRFLALPFGWSLEANPKTTDDVNRIKLFLAQNASEDVKSVTGKHPYEMFTNYEEHGDLGMFGGVAVAGTAFKYMTLKRDGASADELARARNDVVRAIRNQHIFWAVTGTPGVLARGIQRLVDEDPEAPPIPDNPKDLIPLADDQGNALPAPKDNGTWRADNSGGVLPSGTWIWVDSCSKDQLVGQIFAMVLLYDAAVGDPDIDQSLIETMKQDALATARMLMQKREVSSMEGPAGFGEYDLIIMDADGRPTYHHDINPYSLEKVYMPVDGGSYNMFNLAMALGVMKGLFHVTGDPEIETYVYGELMGNRGYLDMIDAPLTDEGVIDYIYADLKTNYSNVNMIATAIWLALYTENDAEVQAPLQNFLEKRWWNREGQTRTARLAKMPFYNMVWMGLTDRGVEKALAEETAALLGAFPVGPYMNDAVINCDSDEISAGSCAAADGTTILDLESGLNRGNQVVSSVALDPSIRPPSNFDARSDPFEVNGGGGLRLNPGGDLLAAYWMGRYLPLNPAGTASVSPKVRSHMKVPGGEPPADLPPETVETAETVESDVIVVADAADGLVADTGRDTGADTALDAGIPGDETTNGPDEQGSSGGSGCSANGNGNGPAPLALPLLLTAVAFALAAARRKRC